MEHLRKLPLDLPPIIWNYLSIYDVFRFGRTAKNILNITWPWYEKLYIPFTFLDRLKSVLERDLNRIRTLEFSYGELLDEQAPFLIQQIEGLKCSTLPNLHSLIVRFYCSEKIIVDVSAAMCDLVTRMTQLHLIALHDIGEQHDDSLNIGQLLVNHTRLTSLTIYRCPRALHGVSLLTNLKNLGLSEIPDDTLIEAAALTRLTSLDIILYGSIDKSIAHQAIVEITSLVNLEKLSMPRSDTGNLNILFRLEKLSQLALNYPNDTRGAMNKDFELFGQLTNLTHLLISGFGMRMLSVSSLTKLTNLLELILIRVPATAVDFRPLTRLTTLEFFSYGSSVIEYPPNLKKLSVELNMERNDVLVEKICGLKLLQSLNLDIEEFDWNAWSEYITQLNQLQTLSLSSAPTCGMLQALQQLPNLAVLECHQIQPETIEDLAKLTQLMRLSVNFVDEKDLKAKVPFYVGRS